MGTGGWKKMAGRKTDCGMETGSSKAADAGEVSRGVMGRVVVMLTVRLEVEERSAKGVDTAALASAPLWNMEVAVSSREADVCASPG